MSAPAALAMAKLFYPETRENRRIKVKAPRIPKYVFKNKLTFYIPFSI